MISKELMEVLACPKCKGDLKQKGSYLVCEKCRLKFKILEGGIPDMLIEDAEKY